MKKQVHVCSANNLRSGDVQRVECDPAVALFNIAGNFFAVADLCTHAKASISDGYLDEIACTVECPLHGAIFSLETGAALTQPATMPLEIFPVSVRDEDIFVDIEER